MCSSDLFRKLAAQLRSVEPPSPPRSLWPAAMVFEELEFEAAQLLDSPGLEPMRVETARFFERELQRIRFKTASAAQVKSEYKIEEADDEVWGFHEPLGGISLTLIEIPAGRFTMGSPNDEPERYSDEGPQHELELRSFFMSQIGRAHV